MNIKRDGFLEYSFPKSQLPPTKIQPDLLCHCPQLCRNKLPKQKWKEVFDQFHKIADLNAQNRFLQNHIVIKAVHNNTGKLSHGKRRVTCRYKIPILASDQSLEMLVEKRAKSTVEVCQKAFMNIYGLSEKRIRVQRERCIECVMPDYYVNKSADHSRVFKEAQFDQSNTDCSDAQPLDLSKHAERSFELSSSQMDDFAQMLGISREVVTQDMIKKYEEMVKRNIEKQKKCQARKRKLSNDSQPSGIAKHVVGLNDKSGVIPSQTLNNGDITITPIPKKTESYSGGITITPVKRKTDRQPPSLVDQEHFMQVDSFFQNQLWQLELLQADENQQG